MNYNLDTTSKEPLQPLMMNNDYEN